MALLWSANPTLVGDIPATEHILTSTALARPTTECGSPTTTVPNNAYGGGRLDARAAAQQARVDVAWLALPPTVTLPANGTGQFQVALDARQVGGPGTYSARILIVRNGSLTSIPVTFTVQPAANTASLRGRLTDLWRGGGVYGRLQMGDGPAVQSDMNGYYTVTLPYGSYALTATATGYFEDSAVVSITAPSAADFILEPDLPHVQVGYAPISATLAFGQRIRVPITVTNSGTRPLTVTATVPALEWIVDQAGVPAGSLYDLSGTRPIGLTDDSIYSQPIQLGFAVPIYGSLGSQLYLSSNGWVSAVEPSSADPLANCLPNASLPPS